MNYINPFDYYVELTKKSRNTKDKKNKLNAILKSRGVPGEIRYQWKKYMTGWFLFLPHESGNDPAPQYLGHNYAAAEELIGKGILDYVKEWRLK